MLNKTGATGDPTEVQRNIIKCIGWSTGGAAKSFEELGHNDVKQNYLMSPISDGHLLLVLAPTSGVKVTCLHEDLLPGELTEASYSTAMFAWPPLQHQWAIRDELTFEYYFLATIFIGEKQLTDLNKARKLVKRCFYQGVSSTFRTSLCSHCLT